MDMVNCQIDCCESRKACTGRLVLDDSSSTLSSPLLVLLLDNLLLEADS